MIPSYRRRAARAAAWIALAAALVVPRAVAADASPWPRPAGWIERPAAGERLAVGTTATVRWTRLPAEVDEFELLLSLDGGRSYAVRLTPRLDPATRELSWVVPNLPAEHARLRLRVGVGGRELESAPSAPFVILASRRAPPATLRFADGEWWTAALAAPPPCELPARDERAGLPTLDGGELTLALLPDETHSVAFTPAQASAAQPVGALHRPTPAERSNPARPVAPPQRE